MAALVRTVCVACLQSLELSSGDDDSSQAACPFCGHLVDLSLTKGGSDTPTTGDGFASPPPTDPDALTPKMMAAARLTPGRIGRFLLREPLGEGGYGQVYRAYDPHLERDIALKLLKPNRLGEKALERFYREARAAARLDHPNIVGLHDAGRDEGRCWIAYQLIPGQTLSMVRDLERPSLDTSVRIVRDLALALDHAHKRGVFHRDLKPANVLIDESGRPRLTDFGLARRGDLDSDLTQEGTVLGTPQYMSPEAAAGRAHEADGRSDVYSLGVILYELICGKRPADVPSSVPVWRTSRIVTPPTPRTIVRSIPMALDRICMRALAFDPDARYPDAQSLADALTRYSQGRTASQPVRRPVEKSGLAIGLIVAASVLCLALGMSLHFADRGAPAVVPAAADLERTSDVLLPEMARIVSSKDAAEEPQTSRTALRPPLPAAMSRDDLLGSPVVRTAKGNEVFHLKGGNCQHIKKIDPATLIDLGDARTAMASTALRPCHRCLGGLISGPDEAASSP